MVGRYKPVERWLLYLTLTALAIVFVLPFAWMVGGSMKAPREMRTEHLRLYPVFPAPAQRSPFVGADEFGPPGPPEGYTADQWRRVRPPLSAAVAERLRAWLPRVATEAEPLPLAAADAGRFREQMALGLERRVALALTDGARAEPSDGPAASGTRIAREAGAYLDERALAETADRIWRRFGIGEVRFRTGDYQTHTAGVAGRWRNAGGGARLSERSLKNGRYQLVEYDAVPGRDFAFVAAPDVSAAVAEAVDRVFVTYRTDMSWNRVAFEVTRNGRRYRTHEVIPLRDSGWVEAELRWPDPRADPMERRAYNLLRDAGPAEGDAFTVGVRLTLNSRWGAVWDKALANYRAVFREIPFGRYLLTSLVLCFLNIALTVFSCSLCAFGFSRLRWPGRDALFGAMLATMMLPAQVTMIPGFILIRTIGWYDTLLPLWLLSACGNAFFIFLLRQFMRSIPADLEDAARIDGCGTLRIYWHVALPLVRPTLATVAIFTFIGTWNNFMGPLIYLNNEALFPLALGLYKFQLTYGGDIGLMMAGSLVMTLPIVVLFLFLQRYFIQGIALTGTKG